MNRSLRLTVSSPPQSFTEPLTTADVISYLSLPSNYSEHSRLESWIRAARVAAEWAQNRDLVTKSWDLTLDLFPGGPIALRDYLQSVDLVKYRDSDGEYTTLAENTDYIVDTAATPGLVMPPYNESWPSFTAWPSGAVLIRFTAGIADSDPWWLAEGDFVKQGMLLLISHWFNGRLPFEVAGTQVHEYPYGVTALLSYGALRRV